MSRKDVLTIFIIFFAGTFVYVVACRLMKMPLLGISDRIGYLKAIRTYHEGEKIPSIEILLSDSSTYLNVSKVSPGRPIVLFYFAPYCPYCRSEMEEIIKNIGHLKDIQFYLITPYPFSDMRMFYYSYNIYKYDNIKVGVDFNRAFGDYFKTQNVPYLAIYNRKKKLNAAFLGNVKYDQIKVVSEF